MGSPSPPAEAAPAPVVVRKFPAPCWSQDETLALIHAYQDKWFSLRRRNLRTADWEAVAEEVNRRCPNQSPPKTSAQCRHKMEKLRKRYRTEKQRISNLPMHHNHNHNSSRFGLGLFPSSSWVFFDLMDAMEIGSAPGSTNIINTNMNVHNPNPNPNPNHYPPKENGNGNGNGGFVVKEEKVMRGKQDLGKYFDDILMSVGKGPIKFKLNNTNTATATAADDDDNRDFDDNDNDATAFDYTHSNTSNFASASASASRFNHNNNNNKRKMSAFVNGCSFNKRPAPKRSAVGDMVASINMLGDGLLKMEKMKMELMQDLQRQRMQMDLHNTKIILDSQHSILTAFLHGFSKLKSSPSPYPT